VTTQKLVPKPSSNGQESPEEQRQKMLEMMAEFGDSVLTVDNSVAFHVEPKNKVSLPDGMPKEKGAAILIESARGDAEMQTFSRSFRYRPWDGAYALHKVLLETFGTSGRGRKTFSFMEGVKYPEAKTVEIGIKDDGHPITAQIPWGEIDFEFFEGHLTLGAVEDEDYGQLFHLSVHAPKRLAASIYGFFAMVELYLDEHSIYKGKAITGTDNPRFLHVKRNHTIVYNDDVSGMMTDTVWGVMANADLLKSDKTPRRVNTRVVLEGPYGTGKSEFGMITAEVAQGFGWTFIEYRIGDHPNVADLQKTLMTAKLLQPAVVFIEDINIYAGRESEADQTKLTNMIDGLGSKGSDIMIVMTSNHAEEFSEAMLRDGRIDALIHVGLLDRPSTEKMIRRVVGEERLDPELDYDRVWEALADFEPAFVRGTFEQACTSAIIRTSSLEYILTTSDLVRSANLKRPQWEMLHRNRKKREVTIEERITQAALAPWQSGRVQLYDAAGRPMQVKVIDAA